MPRMLCVVLLIVLVGIPNAWGECPEALAGLPFGEVIRVVTDGSYAYFRNGPALLIADISDPTAPEVVAQMYYEEGGPQGLAVGGGHLYVGLEETLRVVDVTTPSAPVEIGACALPDRIGPIAILGDHLVVGTWVGLSVVDVSAPHLPRVVGSWSTMALPGTLVVSGNLLIMEGYCEVWCGFLQVFDASDPLSLTSLGHRYLDWNTYDLAVSGSYAYVAAGFDLRVHDLTPPYDLNEVGRCQDTGATGVTLHAGHAYVTDGDLHVVDISTPAAPQLVTSLQTPGYAWSVTSRDSIAMVADGGGGLRLYDLATPSAPVETGVFDTPNDAKDVAILGDLAVVAAGADGLLVFDVSDPSAITAGGRCDTCTAYDLALSGSLVFAASQGAGVRVIDLAAPGGPEQIGLCPTPGYDNEVALAGHHAFVAADYAGLRVFDVQDPSAPIEVAFLDSPGHAEGVAVSGSLAFVADGYQGLRVIDVSEPTAPVEVGSFPTAPYSAQDVSVIGPHVVLEDTTYDLRIIDVSIPSTPVEIATFEINGGVSSVTIVDTAAWVVSSRLTPGVVVLDLSAPTQPSMITSFGPRYENAIAVARPHAFLVGEGFTVFEVDCLTQVFADGFESGDASRWSR